MPQTSGKSLSNKHNNFTPFRSDFQVAYNANLYPQLRHISNAQHKPRANLFVLVLLLLLRRIDWQFQQQQLVQKTPAMCSDQ